MRSDDREKKQKLTLVTSGGCPGNHCSPRISSAMQPTTNSSKQCKVPPLEPVCSPGGRRVVASMSPPLSPPILVSGGSVLSYGPIHGTGAGAYSSIGVASPPSPRCYDIIEEEMIFPMSDITEEDEARCNNDNNNSSSNSHKPSNINSRDKNAIITNRNISPKSRGKCKDSVHSQPIGIIPKIVTEDVDSDTKISTSNESEDSSWKSDKNSLDSNCGSESTAKASTSLPSKSSGTNRVLNHNQLHLHCSPTDSAETGANMADAHPCHYHTVHGTSIGQGHYYGDGSSSPIYSINAYKPRTRSHSGPTYPGGFTQQVRHSALISAGMATLGATSRVHRRQSDDSEATSSSLRARVSPTGSSFFDSFRPRSTSDSKSKKPSVIAAIKNNFLNRHSSSSNSNSANVSTSANSNPHQQQQQQYHHANPSGCSQLTSYGSGSSSSSNGSNSNNSGHSHPHNQSGHGAIVDQQPTSTCTTCNQCHCHSTPHNKSANGTVSAPISPSAAVIDPFSLDYLYARSNGHCDCFQQHHHHHNHHHHNNQQQHSNSSSSSRPRSRSGSSGASSTMARVFDMFRGRSNSIATSTALCEHNQQHHHHSNHNCCAHSSTFSNQDSIGDRIEFEDIDENLVYVRFFKFYRCYDIIPISAKLVVFDTQLAVKKAFFALLSNGVRAAPLWDSARHEFVGMLTITDFIYILRTYYHAPHLKIEELEEHNLDIWRNMLKEKAKPLVWIEPDESLFNAIKMLIHNKVHRLPVIDRDTGNVLYILTHKRILKFLFLYYYTRLPMPSYLMKTLRELPQIGTYNNIAVATPNTPLIQALSLLLEKRVSALPIVDKKNKVIDVYAKFDVIHLAADQMYQNLNITVKKALEYRNQSERVVKCTLNDTLHCILERIVQAEVHRIVVVDSDEHVIGIISLSDLLSFLVLRPVANMKCSKVLEETAEEVLSDSQSSASTADLAERNQTEQGTGSDSLLLDEQNQLTTSSTDSSGTSSSSISSSKLCITGSTTVTGRVPTATNAAQTLIAPLQ